MANPGAKFVSVNLNKSYGQQQQASSHHAPYSSFNGGGGPYGQAAPAGWGRGGGGMTVLSKSRGNAQKVVSKLSVPSPLNLPSLRKEHERFDTAGPSRGAGSGAGPGSGSRPTSTHVGWTKPVSAVALQEKNQSVVDAQVADGMDAKDGISRGIGSYMPPSARSNGLGVVGPSTGTVSRDFVPLVEKAMVLRGEDFPSLQAARPVSSETSQKQKDALNQKQKQIVGEELTQNKRDSYCSDPLIDVHPSGKSSWNTIRNGSVENSREVRGTDRARSVDQIRKEDEYFPSPLPLVRLNPRSDWADDERDTSHGFTERGRDIGYSKNDNYWDGNLDLTRHSVLPHKAVQNQHDRWGQRDNETAGFDDRDLFSGGLVGVIKRKKDAAKSTDFHDPVRESFQAELERVLKMQELERQRIIGEQERATEQARREEEERQRRIREEEERQRRLEEEAREAVWRAEHERLEAIRTAEEQRIAREEDKIRIYMEDERRKQAAKQKLLDLEARIAKRQVEAAKGDASVSNTIYDEQLETVVKERDFSGTLDLDTWEDSERMVDKLTTSTSFDSFASSRPYEMSLRPYPPREGSSSFLDGGKAINYWRRDVFENGGSFPSPLLDQEIDHYSPRRDAFGGGRAVSRLCSYGRSRNSTRPPRVLPPPLASGQRTSFRGVSERSGPSAFLDNHYTNAARNETIRQTIYNGSNQECLEPSEVVGLQQENTTAEDQNRNSKSRCDSQSSLSVSSPPNSPPQLSHDELDESGDSPVKSAAAEVKRNLLTGSGSVVLNDKSGIVASDSISASDDEEWTIENDDTPQQQEEYDEDEDGYIEEDEVREGDDENLELNPKFEGLELQERESSQMMDNVVLGFDEGVEVVIPSDDFEKKSGTQEKTYGIPDSSVDIVEERGLVEGVPAEEQNHLNANEASGTSANSFSGKIQETELVLQGSTGQPFEASYSPETDLLDGAYSLGCTGLPAQQLVSCSGDATAAVGQANMSSLSYAGNPADLPVKLQFGLFSGPSLIPSPVPAIQIGSIQMPLHIHPPVGPSLSHMHPSLPPTFQFGQLQYSSPISQGILSMSPQSMSFIQPNMQAHFNLNQTAGGSISRRPARDASTQNVARDEVPSLSLNKQPGFVSGPPELSHGSLSRGLKSVSEENSCGDYSVGYTTRGVLGATDKKMESESRFQVEEKGHHEVSTKNYLPSSKERGPESMTQHIQQSIQTVSGEKNFSGPRGLGPFYGGRGKRFAYTVKNANTRSSSMAHDMPENSNGFQRRPQRTVQRTEFRIRENNDRRKTPLLVSFNDAGVDGKSSYTGKAEGVFRRSGSKRGTIFNRPLRQKPESEPLVSGNISSQEANSGDRVAKEIAKNVSIMSLNISNPGEADLQKNVSEDVDAPLLRGVVRVFKQPGIEAPSDEDDFIEVRSKRQMHNDRREQREKEIKAKSLTTKLPRKPCASKQNAVVSKGPSKLSVPLGNEESCLEITVLESRHLTNNEVSTGFNTAVFQPLAPIGTPAINSGSQTIKPLQAGSVTVVSSGGTDCEPGLVFESKNKVMDQIQSSSTTWSTAGINQQVMSLTQTQLEEAMKPVRYDPRISTVGGQSSTISDPILPTSSILTKDKTFSSGASPINSLLAGEKIQFGAVTSPTVLPPSSRVVSHVIGAPGSNRPDVQISRKFSVSENDSSLFFEKEKHSSDSCVPLKDCEAEAAASAVAVAAICNDDIVRNGLGPLGAINVPDTKSFGVADIDCITPGVVGDQQLVNQSRGEELLSVSLPADLSVDTTPISLWPPLASPQSSSSQMLSQFSSAPPSHFPFYEMNPMLEGPILAFSPHEESCGTQSLPQKSTASSSGPIGNWQQWHSGVDSFYNPPAGYPGRFISPSGGIPGVQGPPHMVVYNHFAPVGQYGQFGLSFMGTTFIPSGKQSEWKHNQTSTAIHVGEGDINNINMTTTQHNSPNMMAPMQHLAPGSPLLPMASPLPMFNVSPFQTAPDLSVQARWGHVPASPLHSVPLSPPLQPQVEGALPSQVNHGHSVDHSLNVNMFSESRIQTPSDNVPSFSVATETNIAPFPAELGLVDSLRYTAAVTSGQSFMVHSSSGTGNSESGKTDTTHEDGRGNNNIKRQNASSVKPQFSQKNPPIQHGNSSGYNYQRGGISHRNNAGNEWSHRRVGFHGRNHSSSVDRGFPASKIKQIYVAKTDH